MRTATCNEIERKLPAVPAELPSSLSTDGGPSIEHFFGSSEASSFRAARRTFEHKLAHGLQKLDWVQAIVRLFAARRTRHSKIDASQPALFESIVLLQNCDIQAVRTTFIQTTLPSKSS